MTRRAALVSMLLGVVATLTAAPALAQQFARVMGVVQWISAQGMQVLTESGASVAIDLREADQSSYRALRPGDYVLVDGYVPLDRRRVVVARDIYRDSGRGTWTQSP